MAKALVAAGQMCSHVTQPPPEIRLAITVANTDTKIGGIRLHGNEQYLHVFCTGS